MQSETPDISITLSGIIKDDIFAVLVNPLTLVTLSGITKVNNVVN